VLGVDAPSRLIMLIFTVKKLTAENYIDGKQKQYHIVKIAPQANILTP